MAIFDRKDDYLFVRWAREVKKRDHWVCQVCMRRGVELHAHHLNAWASYPDSRYDIDNGITLCSQCHNNFHDIMGKGNNTAEQFEEYSKICDMILRNATINSDCILKRNLILNKLENDLENDKKDI